MSSPDLFLHSITLMMMIAMRVMPATAAITIHNVLFLSFPCPAKAALSGEEGDFNSVNQPHNCTILLFVVFKCVLTFALLTFHIILKIIPTPSYCQLFQRTFLVLFLL